ncbi:transglutaminase domain-containing protein [Dokdonella sp.]|uniref:transglutaminase-like domain-containing protein n=1 Tax=Dokdonella sp. TaxID=2291710 RepID=UPI002C84CD66|nr:transglutaminase domain-containing protein [Dokdonella sp.]HPN80021.1 transglutaminase domain-containing protein [Dokdonella sp.]
MHKPAVSLLARARCSRQGRRQHVWLLLTLLLAQGACAAGQASIDAVIASIEGGQFQSAERSIADALAQASLEPDSRKAFEFQRERMRRILLDFTLDEAALKEQLRKQIPDLADAEFVRWDAHGLFERQTIDGRTLYFNRSASNLFRLSAEARARRAEQTPMRDGPMEAANAHHRDVLAAARPGHERGLASRHLKITQSLSVHADAVPAGEIVRAWIPYPRAIPGQQDDVRFRKSVPAKHVVAPESALQRTVYLERRAEAGKPTEFSVSYELTISAQSHAIDATRVAAAEITAELAPFVTERPPHIVFNEAIRLFSRQIVGDEKNPWRIAQKLYAAVDSIPWAGAREYSTISNISDYALHAGHADCGQQTLLLMTLLRFNGIPSRWQSGMVYSDGDYSNLHDWGQLYIAPYGWIPMDVTTGRLHSDDPAIANFYLGGQDAYRIAFNDDYGREFVPAKTHFRSETVDLQRGEAEWSGGNLYFDQWDYDFTWQVSPVGD